MAQALAADRRSFGRDTTAAEVIAGIDLSGRRALVTGASGGLGAETAQRLAGAGAAVTLTARDVDKGERVASAIRAAVPGADVEVMELALHEPESVERFAREWVQRHRRLDILVDNAGVMACPLTRTREGWELQFATNHLGHFLLTGRLARALRAGAPARVVSVSSAGHRFSPVVFEDVHFERRPYDKWLAYGQSKTANVLFAVELDRRLRDEGVRAFALHPGAIVTELGRHLRREDLEEMNRRVPGGGGLRFKTVEAGAATSVWAASAPELAGQGGLYLEDCHVAGLRSADDAAEGYRPWAVDLEAARRLWDLSEQTLGRRF